MRVPMPLLCWRDTTCGNTMSVPSTKGTYHGWQYDYPWLHAHITMIMVVLVSSLVITITYFLYMCFMCRATPSTITNTTNNNTTTEG